MAELFPVGGPRAPVYNALRSRGFVESGYSDKHWTRADGLRAHIYGAGSMLRVYQKDKLITDGPMAESLAKIPQGV